MNYNKLINNHRLVSIALYSLMFFIFYGCSDAGEIQQLPERSYELVWSDEFDGAANELPDAGKWAFDLGNNNGWGNNEYQIYTRNTENVSMDGKSNLAITATKMPTKPYATYYSGRIITKGLFSQSFGRFEARIKLPYGPGIWPAFWLLGTNIDSLDENNEPVGWPQCGEIDIMEMNGSKPNIINGTLHGPGYSGGTSITKSFGLFNERYDTDFHLFAIEWGKDYIDFFVDNTLYQKITPANVTGKWVFNDNPFFILLNLAVGGNYVTGPTDQTVFPQQMLVDYVRVYKEIN